MNISRSIALYFTLVILSISLFAIIIVIINGGIYLFSIGNFHIAVHDLRRSVIFLTVAFVILLYLKKINIILTLDKAARYCDRNIFLVIALFAVMLSWLKILQLYTFDTGIDLPIFDYAIFNTLHGNFMYSSIVGRNFLSDHFSPILILLVPFYTGSYGLMVIQSIITAFSGYFLYRLSKISIKDNLASIFILIAYLGSDSLMRGFFFDFHIEMFIPLFILGAFYFFKARKYLQYWVFIFLAIMCKEDIAIYLIFFGVYLFVFGRNKKIGIITSVLSLAWVILVLKIIIPFLHPEKIQTSYYLTRWQLYGSSYSEVLKNIILRPGDIISVLLTQPSIDLFKDVLFLPLLSPATCFLIFVPLILNLISNFGIQANLSVHYVIPIIPFLWISVISGLSKIKKRKLLLCITAILAIINFGYYRFYKINSHIILGHKILEMIPKDAKISTQSCFIPHLEHPKDIWIFPRIENSNYILVDVTKPFWPFKRRREFIKEIKKYKNNKKWQNIVEVDGYYLSKRVEV